MIKKILGIETGVDLAKLVEVGRWLAALLGRERSSVIAATWLLVAAVLLYAAGMRL